MSGAEKKFERYQGGPLVAAAGVGVVGLALTGVRALLGEPLTALFSYMLAFAYWLGIGLAALILVMIFGAAKARWPVVARRVLEVMAATLTIFPILFLPILIWHKQLFPWAAPSEELGEEALHLIHHRHVYLNTTFFFIRAAIYFGVWVGFSRLLFAWSTRQDSADAPELTRRTWTLGAGGLPAVGITVTFAAIDWLMSLSLFWNSSIWGVYYFAGSLVGCVALWILSLRALEKTPALAGALGTAHWLSVGKFLLAFTCFWAYVSFSQYMLTFIANLPDAIPFLFSRKQHGWRAIGILLFVGHFVVPFLILLTRWVKMKSARLAVIASWILIIHFVDLYWVVMPHARPEQPIPDWSNLTALLGVGGVAFAFALWTLRGRHAIPVGDPFLEDSLHYQKMM